MTTVILASFITHTSSIDSSSIPKCFSIEAGKINESWTGKPSSHGEKCGFTRAERVRLRFLPRLFCKIMNLTRQHRISSSESEKWEEFIKKDKHGTNKKFVRVLLCTGINFVCTGAFFSLYHFYSSTFIPLYHICTLLQSTQWVNILWYLMVSYGILWYLMVSYDIVIEYYVIYVIEQ